MFSLCLKLSQIHLQLDKEFISYDPCREAECDTELSSCSFHGSVASGWDLGSSPVCVRTCRHTHLQLDSLILYSLCSNLLFYKAKPEWGKNCCCNIFFYRWKRPYAGQGKGKGKGRADTRKCFMEPYSVCAQHSSPKHCGFSFVTQIF